MCPTYCVHNIWCAQLVFSDFILNLHFSDELVVVKDGKYGAESPQAKSGWDGMIGELIRFVSITANILKRPAFVHQKSHSMRKRHFRHLL